MKKTKLDLSRDREWLKNPSQWGQDLFERRRVCMKTHHRENQRFGIIYDSEPLTIYVHDPADVVAGRIVEAKVEKFKSIDAMLKVWMVD